MKKVTKAIATALSVFAAGATMSAPMVNPAWAANCNGLPTKAQLQALLAAAPTCGGCSAGIISGGTTVGGLFNGSKMWGAVVDRDGEVCAFSTSTADPTQVWPGSQAIAKAKADTANAFSNNSTPLSTAVLYTFVQPGHSLFGLNNSNPFNPNVLAPPGGQGGGKNQIAGGIITFGGGVPLYNSSGQIIGGLGVSGDTACADHEVAKRVRDLAGMNPLGGPTVDDITYSSVDGATVFTHPLCPNTFRNGTSIGSEPAAVGY